ncbi:hypothetical protein PVK74_10640 [Micromonospora chalcea]|uniref:hypothetical protein n=1 Tax=Micromonospora chalcea TaxID=1874 RepID=UPI0023784C48|nr:hypothetical protein [Micromonospora chalcea]WDQ02232.1 hypothetical protein PVK74_10640 [Micromonospora chalcea]
MPTNDKRMVVRRRTESRQHRQAGAHILAQRHSTQHDDLEHRAVRGQHAVIGSTDAATAVTA